MTKLATKAKTRDFVLGEIPGTVRAMGEMASDPAIKPSFRLRAIELLLRMGTTDHRANPDAKIQLTRAIPLLEKMITSQISPSTISRATLFTSNRRSEAIEGDRVAIRTLSRYVTNIL
jgi:hypothetical protein